MSQRPTQEVIEEGYKQAKLNARCKALDIILMIYQSSAGEPERSEPNGEVVYKKPAMKAEHMVAEAKLLEEYMLAGIEPPKPSSIIQMKNPH